MMDAALVIIYVVFCLLAGLCGTRRRMGFFGTFLASFVLTPVVVVLVLVLTEPRRRVPR
jgi:hypothetical protein